MQIRFLSAALALAALGSLAPLAADPAPPPALAPTALQYTPTNLNDHHTLRVDITQVLLADAETGMKGYAQGEVKLTTPAPAPGDTGVAVCVTLTKLRQQMSGHALKALPPDPLLLRLDGSASLTGAPCQEKPATGEILSQGGLPLQAVAVICAVPQLPDHPVSPGDTWQRTRTYDFPGLGNATVNLTTTLVSLQAGVATLNSHLVMHVPDFDADNPVLPGQKIKVHNLVVEVTDLTQQYDCATSVVLQAAGKLKATLEANAPDLSLPLEMRATISYSPPPPAAPGKP